MINQKKILRELFIKKKNFTETEVIHRSDRICNHLAQTLLFQEAVCIALYCSIENEVNTYALMNEYRLKKNIILPVVSQQNMSFYPFTGKENLTKGAFGIMEPISRDIVPPESIDLFIVPGVAFDFDYNRLGRGKGYYDRFLSDIDKPVIGLCFDYQLIASIPHEAHDKKMTLIIAENTIVSPRHQ